MKTNPEFHHPLCILIVATAWIAMATNSPAAEPKPRLVSPASNYGSSMKMPMAPNRVGRDGFDSVANFRGTPAGRRRVTAMTLFLAAAILSPAAPVHVWEKLEITLHATNLRAPLRDSGQAIPMDIHAERPEQTRSAARNLIAACDRIGCLGIRAQIYGVGS
jgi:hypothetical protein